ncbi:hypothetical protein [Hafnia psychrotolerans]|uniref:DUF2489 domain-containing protein n=1 Tax=Hafnia psychrotolerans TaxID=1477018 RepID=A0ABQ1GUF6_9GAMM|nr:hypothetical protein [Hafnia psychrotolerans]GGA49741.1 hypothetical protein GCM10011328_26350 [Hafnia psychrotolerans]
MATETVAAVTQFPWAALITALAGLSGGLGGALLANRFADKRWNQQITYEKEKEKAKILREKGEELHVLVSKWSKSTINYQLCQLRVVAGKLTESQFHDVMEKNPSEPGVHDRLETLLFLYFPEFEVHMKSVRNRLSEGNSAYDDVIKGVMSRGEGFERVERASNETELELENIKLGIRQMLKKLN